MLRPQTGNVELHSKTPDGGDDFSHVTTKEAWLAKYPGLSIPYSTCNPPGANIDAADCRGSFVVPTDLTPGVYTFMWWWEFNPGQFYNSCADIRVLAQPADGGEGDGGNQGGDQNNPDNSGGADGANQGNNGGTGGNNDEGGGMSTGAAIGLFFLGSLLGVAAALYLWQRKQPNAFAQSNFVNGGTPTPSPAAPPPAPPSSRGQWKKVLDENPATFTTTTNARARRRGPPVASVELSAI